MMCRSRVEESEDAEKENTAEAPYPNALEV